MDRNLKLLILSALLSANVLADTTFYDAVKWDFGSSLTVNPGINVTFSPGSTINATGATLVGFPGGTGASSFLGLSDTPDVYAGQGGKVVAVKADVTGLEFVVPTGGGGGGTVTSFVAGNLAPLFTTTVTTPTTIPTLAFTLSTAGAHTFLGNETSGTGLPHYVQPGFVDLSGDFALTQTPSLAAGTLVGRTSASAGDWGPITVGNGLLMTGTNLTTSATVGNLLSSGTPTANQVAIWTDATHIKGVAPLTGGFGGQVLKKSTNVDYEWEWAADISGSGGSSTFITLTDVPPSYTGAAGKFVAVNTSANGLEFVTAPTGGGGAVTSVFGRTGAVVATAGDYGAFYQPLDTDLTNIAALAGQTTFGQGFLTRVDAAASRTYIGAGTSSFDGTWTSLTGKPTTLVGFGITDAQPLDADLTAIAALSGTNTMYYRSAANTWSAVSFGPNMTFATGQLNAANSNWDTAYNERNQWNGGATGLVAATGRTSLGLDIGTNVQAFDADLSSLAAATSTNAIYYRSAANTWAPVTIAAPVTFSGGVLGATAAGDVIGPASSTDVGFALYSGTTGKLLRGTTSSGIVISTAGVFGTITDNSANWNTAFTQTREWDGGSTGLVAATGRTSLALNNVTNDVQTKAAVVPNTAPAAGQVMVGNGTAYVPKTVSGSGATVTLGANGIMTIDAITNASLANSTMTFATAAVALGGTVTADNAIGLTGSVGLVKRSGVSNYTVAVAGTDYKVGTTSTVLVKIIATTSTYTVPATVNSLYIEGVGGGGGGGSAKVTVSSYAGGGCGGGGGGYAAVYVTNPAASYAVTIGAGGAGGVATTNDAGNNGGNTTVGAILTAGGGTGGCGSNGGFNQPNASGPGGVAGTGTVGSLLLTGGDGGPGICYSSGMGVGGRGGSSAFGGETAAGFYSVAGGAGAKYGGGGSGASCTGIGGYAGGNGFAGMVRVWEFY